MSFDHEPLSSEDAANYTQPTPEPLGVVSGTSAIASLPGDDVSDEQRALKALEVRRAEKARKKRIKIIAGCVVAGGLIAVLVGRALAGSRQPVEEYVPETTIVERKDFVNEVSASGALKAGSSVIVTPEVDGTIASVKVVEGQQVREGDVLFTIKNDALDKAVRDAQTDVEQAERAVASAQQAVDQANATRDDAWNRYNEAFAKADAAHQQWQELRNNYDRLHAQWESDVAAAKALWPSLVEPSEPLAPVDPGEAASEERIAQYNEQYQVYQAELEAYKQDKAAYDAYRSALAMAGEEPMPAGEEPSYPEAPQDSDLVAAVQSAQDGVTTANQALVKAREAYTEAAEQANKRVVKAPASGSVVALGAKVGAIVGSASGGSDSSSSPLVQISDIKKMAVDVDVNEIDILSVKRGQKAKVTFSAVPDVEVEGIVQEVASVASGEGGGIVTFHVGLVIDRPDPKLRAGMTASVRIVTADVKNAIVIPSSAVSEGSMGYSVDVVINEDTYTTESRPVILGERGAAEVVVEEGLEEGEIIMLSGGSGSYDEEFAG